MTAIFRKNCELKITAARMGGLTRLMDRRKQGPLKEDGYRGHIQPTGGRDKKLAQPQIEANHQPWKTDRRVEPIFGIQQMGAGNWMIGSRDLARVKGKIGWQNLTYNLDRYSRLAQP